MLSRFTLLINSLGGGGRGPRRLHSDLAACTPNPQKRLRGKAFPARAAGRAAGASCP